MVDVFFDFGEVVLFDLIGKVVGLVCECVE